MHVLESFCGSPYPDIGVGKEASIFLSLFVSLSVCLHRSFSLSVLFLASAGTDSILRRLLSHYSSSLLSVLYSSAGTPQLPQLPSHHASSSANNLSTSTRNASGLSKAPSAGAPSFSPSSSSRGRGKEGEGGGDELDKMEVAWLEENGGFEPLPLNATMRHIACNMLKTFTTTHVL